MDTGYCTFCERCGGEIFLRVKRVLQVRHFYEGNAKGSRLRWRNETSSGLQSGCDLINKLVFETIQRAVLYCILDLPKCDKLVFGFGVKHF